MVKGRVGAVDAGEAPVRTGSPGFFVYLAGISAVCLAAYPTGIVQAVGAPVTTLAWIAFLLAASLLSLPAAPKIGLDVALAAPVSVSSAVLLPPPLVVVVNSLGFVNQREFHGDASIWMSVFNRAQIGVSAGGAAYAVSFADLGIIGSTAVAAVVHTALNTLLVAVAVLMRRRTQLRETAARATAPFPRFLVDFGLVTLLALFVVVAFETVGVWAVVLLAMPLWLGFSALKSARESEDRAVELAARVRELETLQEAARELLQSRRPDHAALVARGALANALDTERVDVCLDGGVAEGLERVAVPGAPPAVLAIPPESSERAREMVDALAGLVGMTLARQTLEQEVAALERARADLAGQILEEGTRERSRLAVALHDDVLPALAAAQIQADNACSAAQAGNLARAGALAAEARDAAQDSISRLREVLDVVRRRILVPGALRHGLTQALEEVKVQYGVEGELRAPEDLPQIPFALEILLLETARGCLTNVGLHAEAAHAEVALQPKEDRILLDVRDDGGGFDPQRVPEGHHGLALMRQRVELVRGRFQVDSVPGQGTLVRVEVPL